MESFPSANSSLVSEEDSELETTNNFGYLFPVEYQQNLANSEREKLTLKMEIEKLFARLKQYEENADGVELGNQLKEQIQLNLKLCQEKDSLLEEIVYLKRELSKMHEMNLEMQKNVEEANSKVDAIHKQRELDDAVVLQQENDRLRERLTDMQNESRENMQRIMGLEAKLKQSNTIVSPSSTLKKLIELENRCDQLMQENEQLKQENETLKADNIDKHEFGTEGRKLKSEIGELNHKISELNGIIDQQHDDMEQLLENLDAETPDEAFNKLMLFLDEREKLKTEREQLMVENDRLRDENAASELFTSMVKDNEDVLVGLVTEKQEKMNQLILQFAISVENKISKVMLSLQNMEEKVHQNTVTSESALQQIKRIVDTVWRLTNDNQGAPEVTGVAALSHVVDDTLKRLTSWYGDSFQSQIQGLSPEVVGLVKGMRRDFRTISERLHQEHCQLMSNLRK